jgi:hypothetical protein
MYEVLLFFDAVDIELDAECVCMYVCMYVGAVRSAVCFGRPDRNHRRGNGSEPIEEGNRATASDGGLV